MAIVSVLALVCLIFAAIPLALIIFNLILYKPPQGVENTSVPSVSVLIPARNEALRIKPVLDAVLANRGCKFEVIVADDASTDDTVMIVRDYASRDDRVRLIETPKLPPGWMGKNNACMALGLAARYNIGLFIDADVSLAPDAIARISGFMEQRRLSLASGFPRQITKGFWEKLVVPLIHFILLGYLPLIGMRVSRSPAFATACGQLVAVRLADYRAIGGHGAIRGMIHDGVQLPRVFRRNGMRTDLFDAEHLASTQMYDNLRDLWAGFIKNAHEGMATPIALPIWTIMLGFGQLLPFILLPLACIIGADRDIVLLAGAACACAWIGRIVLSLRFRQSWLSVLLHPFGIMFMLVLQWTALVRWRKGKAVSWRGRAYSR